MRVPNRSTVNANASEKGQIVIVFLAVLGIIIAGLGFISLFAGFDEDDPILIGIGVAAAIGGFGLFIASMNAVPDCDTKDVQAFTLNVEKKAYVVTKITVCDNGKLKLRGSAPKAEVPLPKVTKS